METGKKVVPIFCDVKPSELRVKDDGRSCPAPDLEKFHLALEEAKCTVGITFDTVRGYIFRNYDVVTMKLFLPIQNNMILFKGEVDILVT